MFFAALQSCYCLQVGIMSAVIYGILSVICRCKDSLFTLATPLRPHELDSFSTKGLNMFLSNCTSDQLESPVCIKTEPSEIKGHNCRSNAENENNGKMEKDVLSGPQLPGWFGKGYAKSKKTRKRRRVR